MKKVININFQGRVIPIEETAYEMLQQYTDSLKRYFANEESRDEIIGDIEDRIAELFQERLKKGATCITDEDVNTVISSMGRPEELEDAGTEGAGASAAAEEPQAQAATEEPKGRLYRNENDKILGGVCSGLANYLKIDPAVVRILFALITFGGFGFGFLLYIIMWIILPAKGLKTNVRKRLFRDPDNKVIGGVASGLSKYFKIDVWIPRLIFALPFILGIITSIFRHSWFEFDPAPIVFTGGFGGTLFITYIILWIVLPEASTTAEKLEMRGEKVDLQSIKNTVKEEMQSVKSRAEKFGAEVKEGAKNFAAEAAPVARSAGSGIGHAIGVLFKAFFLFIAGIIVIVLFGVLIGFIFGGVEFFPLKSFLLEGFWQNAFAWGTLLLFLGVPVLALLTWLIRRIIGVKSKSKYLGYIFGSLWIIGLICFISLLAGVSKNFRSGSMSDNEEVQITQPPQGKLFIDVASSNTRYFGGDWFGIDRDDWPFYGINQDTLMLNTIRVNVAKSKDTLFHIYKVRMSRGTSPEDARDLSEKIQFNIQQKDSLIELPKGFAVSSSEKFRNQKVLVIVEVPVGKRIELDRSLYNYDWFNVNVNRRRGWNIEIDDDWDRGYSWRSDVDYIMTPDGLERVDRLDEKELKNGKFKLRVDKDGVKIEAEGEFKDSDNDGGYRYHYNSDSSEIKKDSAKSGSTKKESDENTDNNDLSMNLRMPVITALTIFF